MASLKDALMAGPAVEPDMDDMAGEETSLAQDLISAVEAKDAQGVADAVRALFAKFDSEPHVEGGE